MVEEADWHAMEAPDMNRTEGTEVVPTAVPNPPRAGGVKAALVPGKGRLRRIASIVAKGVTK